MFLLSYPNFLFPPFDFDEEKLAPGSPERAFLNALELSDINDP